MMATLSNDGLFALLGHGIMLMALLLMLFQVRRWKQYWPVPYLLSAVIIVFPIQDWTVIEFSRGYFSDLSVATVLICFCFVFSGMRPKPIVVSHAFKLSMLLMCAIIFPSSLGANDYDLFSLGFPSEPGFNYLVIGLALVGLFAWYKNEKFIAVYVMLVFVAYSLGLYASENLWVYMLDPIVLLIFIAGYLRLAGQLMYVRVKDRLNHHA